MGGKPRLEFLRGWIGIAIVLVVIAAVTGWAARRTLFATLASID